MAVEHAWIDWQGGECPVAVDAAVEVQHRSGQFSSDCIHFHIGESRADLWPWHHTGGPDDVIGYRFAPA